MLRRLLTVVTPLLGAAFTLASVFLLLWVTLRIELMESPALRTLAILGALIGGIFLLVGSVYVCTRLAVLLFAEKPKP
jgi:hypothetical protein